jgi:hypothetical protein
MSVPVLIGFTANRIQTPKCRALRPCLDIIPEFLTGKKYHLGCASYPILEYSKNLAITLASDIKKCIKSGWF